MTRVPPSVHMRWHDLAFLHWQVEPAAMRRVVPGQLELDLHDGAAWIGLVPFEMRESRFRGIPDTALTRQFFECNVRTYVRHEGQAGVWFFSLDAERLLPVLGARLLWSLPYIRSRFTVSRTDDTTDYALRRRRGGPGARVHWRRGATLPPSRNGTLEHFLTERYLLFSIRGGQVLRGRVEHAPWTLRRAEILGLDDGLVAAAGLCVAGAPLAFASDGVDVVGWPLEPSRGDAVAGEHSGG